MKRFIITLLIALLLPLARVEAAAPEAPNNLAASVVVFTQQVALSWAASPTADALYRVYRSTSSTSNGTALVNNLSGLTYTDITSVYNTTYYYRVAAVLNDEESAVSAAVSVKPIVPVPLNVKAEDTTRGKEIKITWERPTQAVPLKYNVYRSTTGASLGSAVASNLDSAEYLDKSAVTGTAYVYSVKAVYGSNTLSEQSAGAAATATDVFAPAEPDNVRVSTVVNGKATVSWSAPANESGLKYIVYRDNSPSGLGAQITETASTSYADTLPAGSSTYYYRVVARDTSGNKSQPSAAVGTVAAVTPKITTPLATDLKAKASGTSGQLSLSWRNPSSSTFSFARIYRGLQNEVGSLIVDNFKGSSYVDKNLANGQKYFYAIRLVDKDNKEHEPSAVVGALPYKSSRAVVGAPTNLTAEDLGTGSAIRLSWYIAALRDQNHVNIYRSEIATSTGELLIAGVLGTSYEDKTAAAAKRYFYTIKAVNKDGIESIKNIPLAAMPTLSTVADGSIDTDQDGLTDAWERKNGFNPLAADNVYGDDDKDELTLLEEYKANTNAWAADSDSDGHKDGLEVRNGYDPLGAGRKVVAKVTAVAGNFAYAKARLSLAQEKALADELSRELKIALNKKTLPFSRAAWPKLVNAYVYGGYSVAEIANTARFGPGQVHPTIPAAAWRQSAEYKRAIR